MLKPCANREEQVNGQLTIYGLYIALEKYMNNGGHPNAYALVSDDPECNGYHGLFFGIEEHDYTAGVTDNLSDTNTPMPVQPVIA